MKRGLRKKYVAAFTVAELGEMLPIETKHGLLEIRKGTFYKGGVQWQVMYTDALGSVKDHFENAITEGAARAKMLIYLLETHPALMGSADTSLHAYALLTQNLTDRQKEVLDRLRYFPDVSKGQSITVRSARITSTHSPRPSSPGRNGSFNGRTRSHEIYVSGSV
jgi:hypothetical protein